MEGGDEFSSVRECIFVFTFLVCNKNPIYLKLILFRLVYEPALGVVRVEGLSRLYLCHGSYVSWPEH